MRQISLVAALASLLAIGVYAQQHAHPAPVTAKEVVLVGEVIDPICYLTHGSQGTDHRACAEACIKQGMSLAVLEEKTAQVYISLPADHSNPNAKLKDFVAQKVKVAGTLYTKGGLTGLHVKTVQRVQ